MSLYVPAFPASVHLSGWTGLPDPAGNDPLGVECFPLDDQRDAFASIGPDPYLHILGFRAGNPDEVRAWAVCMLGRDLVDEEAVEPDFANFERLLAAELERLEQLPWAPTELAIDDVATPVERLQPDPTHWAATWRDEGATWACVGVDVPPDVALISADTAAVAELTAQARMM